MDAETADFYSRVRKAYLEIAEREPERFLIIDGNRSVEEIHAHVWEIVRPMVEKLPSGETA